MNVILNPILPNSISHYEVKYEGYHYGIFQESLLNQEFIIPSLIEVSIKYP
jgi:hypothetical protein